MSRKPSKEEASKFLSDVRGDDAFWFCNGVIVRNIYELLSGINHTDEETFKYHANEKKNDFSAWIKGSIGDEALSNELLKSSKKKDITKRIEHRIHVLERITLKSRRHSVVVFYPYLAIRDFLLEFFGLDLKSFLIGFIFGFVVMLMIGALTF